MRFLSTLLLTLAGLFLSTSARAACEFDWKSHNGLGYTCDTKGEAAQQIQTLPDGDDQMCKARWGGGWLGSSQSIYFDFSHVVEHPSGHFTKQVTCASTNGRSRSDMYLHHVDYREPGDSVGPGFVAPGRNAATCPAGDNGSNPIHSALGHKVQEERDVDAVGMLGFTRIYSSRGWGASNEFDGRWRHSFDLHVQVEQVWEGSEVVAATLRRADGQALRFTEDEGDFVSVFPDVKLRLTAMRDESEAIVGWQVRDEADVVEHYSSTGRLLSMRNRNGEVLEFHYSNRARLLKVTDGKGRSVEFVRSALGRITALVTPTGEGITFGYDSEERLVSVTYPAAGGGQDVRSYVYENVQFPRHLTGIVDENGDRYATWSYDAAGRAVSSSHGEDEVDEVLLAFNPDGSTTASSPLGKERRLSFVTQHGQVKLEELTDQLPGCGGHQSSRTYDGHGFLSSSTDFLGSITTYDHDDLGRELERVEAVGTDEERETRTSWLGDRPLPISREMVDGSVVVSRSGWAYNARGQVTAVTSEDPALGTTRLESRVYCEEADATAGTCPRVGLLVSIDGPRTDVGDVSTFLYYATDHAGCGSEPTSCPYRKGDLWKATNALGHVTEYMKYDGAGRVLSVKDSNAVITDFEYHPRGWLTARKERGANASSEADDRITRIEYWPTGLVRQVTQPDDSFVSYAYDTAHRLTDVFDGDGNRIHYTLDNAGNRIAEDTTDEDGVLMRKLSRVYNQLGQLEAQKDAFGNSTDFTYDANGNLETTTDALERVTAQDQDPLNRLLGILQDIGGIEAETIFEYDVLDNLTKVTDPKGLGTEYTYNAFGDLLELSSPDTGTTTYAYDSAGNRASQTEARGVTVSYTYDALNRLTAITYSDGSPGVTYLYDDTRKASCPGPVSGDSAFARGRLSRMADASGSTQYCYDRFGNLTGRWQVVNGKQFITNFTYAQAGLLESIAYPGGAVVDYVRDAQGRVAEIGVKSSGGSRQVLLTDAIWYPFGAVGQWTYGNGRTMSRSLNLNYQPGFIEAGSTDGINLGYGFDAVGNLEKLRPADQTDPPHREYRYDGLDRLTETLHGTTLAPLQSYGYDATGNRTSAAAGGAPVAYTYPVDSHRLSQVGTIARTYDAVGNTLTIGGTAREFAYDAANRMRQAKQAGVIQMNYVYNGKGEQVRRHLGSANTYTVFDESGRWLGDFGNNGSSAALQQAIWLDDLPVGLLVGSGANQKLYYVEPDALGTPRVVVDPARNPATHGAAVWRWEITGEAFGDTAPDQDPDGDGTAFVFDMRFPGQRHDAATGLNYNLNRDYETAIGRYSTSDPIGQRGGINTYAYANNSPLTWIDPDGLQAGVGTYPGYYPTRTSPVPGARPGLWPGIGGLAGCLNPVVGGILLMMVPGNIGQDASCSDDPMKQRQECRDEACPPCRTVSGRVVPVGTIGFRSLDTPSRPQHGISGPHYNLLRANQAPKNSPQPCKCFWQPIGAVAPGNLPAGAIPVEPFVD